MANDKSSVALLLAGGLVAAGAALWYFNRQAQAAPLPPTPTPPIPPIPPTPVPPIVVLRPAYLLADSAPLFFVNNETAEPGPPLSDQQNGAQHIIPWSPGDKLLVAVLWRVRNDGEKDGQAGLEVRLMLRTNFGDETELVVSNRNQLSAPLALRTELRSVVPLRVPAGGTADLQLELHIPCSALQELQDNLPIFVTPRWWMAQAVAYDMASGQSMDGQSTAKISEWFLLQPNA